MNSEKHRIGVIKAPYDRWRAYINYDGKQINLGYFSTFDDAVKAREEAEKKYPPQRKRNIKRRVYEKNCEICGRPIVGSALKKYCESCSLDRMRTTNRENARKNKEKYLERAKKYNREHRDEIYAARKNDPEKRKKYIQATMNWKKSHPERTREIALKSWHKNKEKYAKTYEIPAEDIGKKCPGVTFRRDRGTWVALITVNKKQQHIGTFRTFDEAAAALNRAKNGYDDITKYPRVIDLTGQTFGQLTVLGFSGKDKDRGSLWRCRCSCGNELVVRGGSLKSGNTTSCGCKTREIVCKRCGKVFSAHGSRAMYCDNCKLIIKRELQHRRERREKINQHKFERGEYIDKTTDNKSEHYQAAALADNKPRGDNKFKGVCRTYYGKEIKYYGRIRVRKNGVIYGFSTEKFATQKEAHEAYLDLKAQLVGDTLDDYIRKRQERDKRKKAYEPKKKYRKGENNGDK